MDFTTHPTRQSYRDKATYIVGIPYQYTKGETVYNIIDYTDQDRVYLGTKLISKHKLK